MTRLRVVAAFLLLSTAAPMVAAGPCRMSARDPHENAHDCCKDLVRLATFYHPDVTIHEGGSINIGRADYRDHHLGPELEEMQAPQLTHSSAAVHFLDKEQRSAYVTSEYRLQTRIKDRDIDSGGLETLVLAKAPDGAWKIRHSHTSSRRRPASSPSPSPAR